MNEPTRNAPESSHYRQLLAEAAGRVVRKEIIAIGKAAARCGDDSEAWAKAIDEFYAGHAELVSQSLCIGRGAADGYVDAQKAALLAYGPVIVEDWLTERVDALVALATGGLS